MTRCQLRSSQRRRVPLRHRHPSPNPPASETRQSCSYLAICCLKFPFFFSPDKLTIDPALKRLHHQCCRRCHRLARRKTIQGISAPPTACHVLTCALLRFSVPHPSARRHLVAVMDDEDYGIYGRLAYSADAHAKHMQRLWLAAKQCSVWARRASLFIVSWLNIKKSSLFISFNKHKLGL